MTEPTIEDVLADELHPWDCPARQVASDQVDALASAAADLPLVDRERGIAVIRLDPELAEELAGWSCPQWECGHPDCKMLRRAARIIGWEQSDDG